MLLIKNRVNYYSYKEIQQLQKISTSTIGHFTDFGFLTHLTCSIPITNVLGPVLTVKLSSGDGTHLNNVLHHAQKGDILVIDTSGNKTHACWGEFRSRRAEEIGLAGVIISGAVTDSSYLKKSNVPVFYESVSPRTTSSLNLEGEINTPVCVGGVVFESGDYVIADEDGIYKLNRLNYKGLIELALKKEQYEIERRQS